MLGSGLLLGILLDTYRVLKVRLRLKGWVVSLIDVLYWSVSAVLVFCLLMISNWGELRFYIFVAVCVGFFLYYHYVSKGAIRGIGTLVDWVDKTLHVIARGVYLLLYLPCYHAVLFLRRLLLAVLRLLWIVLRALFVTPIVWLTRPLWNRIQQVCRPYTQKIHRVVQRLRARWHKKRDE